MTEHMGAHAYRPGTCSASQAAGRARSSPRMLRLFHVGLMLQRMRWLNPSSNPSSAGRTTRIAAAMLACCITLLGLSAQARAQSDSEWFQESGDEPTYWSGKGPPSDSPYAVEQSPDDSYEEDAPPADASDEQARSERAVAEFAPHLQPYGVWVDDGVYGRVWVPNARVVGPSFAPYVTSGHWELTVNDDWLWVSDYPFGWVTFHYGHWVWASNARWAWVPGYRWAPAWVDFRVASPGVAYVGWGPSPPRYVWRNGLFVSFGTRVSVPYVFCPTASVFSVSVNRYVVRDRHRVYALSRETRPYHSRRVYSGVAVRAPSWREARIPERSVPRQRVIGRPQSVSQRASLDRRTLSSRESHASERRFYGQQRRGNAAPGRPAPGYQRPDGYQRRDGFDGRERRAPSYTRPPQNRQRPPANAPRYDRGRNDTPAPRGYAPVQRSGNYRTASGIAPRVDDRYRQIRDRSGYRTNQGVHRPPPSAFQQRGDGRAQQPPPSNTGRSRASAPTRRAQPRSDSGHDGGGARGRPSYRPRGDSRH
jgi:hypothetical protein